MCRNRHCSDARVHIGRYAIYLLLAGLLLAFWGAPVWAHKVMIFAWVEGDTVHTQSKFSRGKKAKNSEVVVYDKEGNQLLEGKTDEQGEFSFKVPKKTDLKVVLKASMGHMAEWVIPAEEITAVAPVTRDTSAKVLDVKGGNAEKVTAVGPVSESVSDEEPKTGQGFRVPTAVGLSRQEVKALIDESLDRKLAPILNMLVDALGHGPTVSEVLGGIGYIFGLVGVALYFTNRRRK
jgi:nickel transport protein